MKNISSDSILFIYVFADSLKEDKRLRINETKSKNDVRLSLCKFYSNSATTQLTTIKEVL